MWDIIGNFCERAQGNLWGLYEGYLWELLGNMWGIFMWVQNNLWTCVGIYFCEWANEVRTRKFVPQ